MRAAAIAFLIALSGCSSFTESDIGAVNAAWSVIRPEYEELLEKSPDFDEDQVARRKRLSDELTRLLLEIEGRS